MGEGCSSSRPQIRIRHAERCRKPPGSDSEVSCFDFKWFPQVFFPSSLLAGGMCCCLPTLGTGPMWIIAAMLVYDHLSKHFSERFCLSSTCVLITVPHTCTKHTGPPRSSIFKLSSMKDFSQEIWCTSAPAHTSSFSWCTFPIQCLTAGLTEAISSPGRVWYELPSMHVIFQ
jgi:hypothetical protein